MPDEKSIATGLELLRKGTQDIPTGCPCCEGGSGVVTDDYEGGLGEVLKEILSCPDCGAVWANHYEIFNQEIIEGSTNLSDETKEEHVRYTGRPEPHAAGDQ